MSRNFLLEIGVEEMPARFMSIAYEQLKNVTETVCEENRIEYNEIISMGTPRRLAVLIRGMAEYQEPLREEIKGPAEKVAFKDGEPTRAAEGFAGSQGVNVEDLVIRPVGHVNYVFAVKKEEGQPVQKILPQVAPEIINRLHFPRSMRWGSLDYRFPRPIRWLVALYGEEVIPFEQAGVKSGQFSYGHRFLCKGPVKIEKTEDYMQLMKDSYVMVNPAERRERINKQVSELAEEAGGNMVAGEDLLEEINNLVEYPVALCGSFDSSYLELPQEVLVTTMQEHQRFIPVQDRQGNLMPCFIAVSNGSEKHLDIIRAGNEKVLRARLDDATFFWKEDLKESLDSRVEHLKKIVFQEKLGTVYQKTERVHNLVVALVKMLSDKSEDMETTERAARLAKADLVTNMVYEFPELEGVMGREYAVKSGESREVAVAIFEHHLPRHAGDDLPTTIPGKALSIADKMDTLVGCFSIGMQPTGSQDPYALRRQALGICHILMECGPGISLQDIIRRAYNEISSMTELEKSEDELWNELHEFFRQRMRGILREEWGIKYDTVEAVLKEKLDDIADTGKRSKVLEEFRSMPEFDDLVTAYTRVSNLSKKARDKKVEYELLEDGAEKNLYDKFLNLEKEVTPLLDNRNYLEALRKISGIKNQVDEFFDNVMVMVEDSGIRDNRLAMLYEIASFMESIADLGKIVVE